MLKRLFKEEKGQDMVEYALLAALIAVVAITILTTLGGKIVAVFTTISDAL